MVTEVQSKEIECPQCRKIFTRPDHASTATCAHCGSCVTLIDQIMDRSLVLHGELLTRGKIVVGPQGKVRANLSATEIDISGMVEGNVTAVQKLNLCTHAKLHGNITAAKLVVAEGASVCGRLEIGHP